MSDKELNKVMVVGLALEKKITQKEAATRLCLSTRQVRRLMRRVQANGPDSIAHKGRGRPSNREIPSNVKESILELLKGDYKDFGPTFLMEKLGEREGVTISKEWLRQLMIKNGMWKAKQKKVSIHRLRARRPHYGELVQIDGSHHDWFEGRGSKCVALVFVDDATGRLQLVHFSETEDLKGYMAAMKDYVTKYGKPQEIYTDKHSVFTVNHMRGGENKGKTQFSRMIDELGIQHHLAHSPQAKGRVERMNKSLQDRLIKEFRLAGISNIDDANDYVPLFIEKYNKKFERKSQEEANRHTPLSEREIKRIHKIFSIKVKRSVSKALTFQYENRIYVINKVKAVRTLRKDGVVVHEFLDGGIKIYSRNKQLDIDFLEYADNYKHPISRKELDIKLDSNKNDEYSKQLKQK